VGELRCAPNSHRRRPALSGRRRLADPRRQPRGENRGRKTGLMGPQPRARRRRAPCDRTADPGHAQVVAAGSHGPPDATRRTHCGEAVPVPSPGLEPTGVDVDGVRERAPRHRRPLPHDPPHPRIGRHGPCHLDLVGQQLLGIADQRFRHQPRPQDHRLGGRIAAGDAQREGCGVEADAQRAGLRLGLAQPQAVGRPCGCRSRRDRTGQEPTAVDHDLGTGLPSPPDVCSTGMLPRPRRNVARVPTAESSSEIVSTTR
jgi:hypothetical protein